MWELCIANTPTGRNVRPRIVLLVAAVTFLLVTAATGYDECRYQMTDRTTVSYLDPFDGTEHTKIIEYWGWVCENPDIPIVETPYPPGWQGPPPPPPVQPQPPMPVPQPPTSSCSLSTCKANCDTNYELALAGNGSNTDFIDMPPRCGVFCVELATADRNACYGGCAVECNNP
jgi:hypothetical protein